MQNQRYPSRPTWIEIDRHALTNNVQQLRRLLSNNVLLSAVVKANAYGHGLQPTAQVLAQAGVDRFAVATLGEAIELRSTGTQQPILVLGYTPAWLAKEAIEHDIILSCYDIKTAKSYDQVAQLVSGTGIPRLPHRLMLHIKANTGMNRLGVQPKDTLELLTAIHQLPHLQVEGIFTHFATSDLLDKSFAWEQFARFRTLLTTLEAANLRPPIAHAANSAATLTMPDTHLEMVRCGISLYGLHPDPEESRLPPGFLPALTWKAIVAQVTSLQPGDSVSYGQEFIAEKPMTVAVIPVGYADGFPRRPHNYGHVLIHGQPAPILGRVCMDQTIVDVTGIDTGIDVAAPVQQGDEVVIIGRQGQAEITVDAVASQIHTNNYDTVSRILGRVPRILVGR